MQEKIENYISRLRAFNKEKDRISVIERNIQFSYPFVSILCKSCGTMAFSFSQHDMRSCACGKSAVDGGSPNFMRIKGDLNNIELIYPCKIQNKSLRKKYKDFQNEAIYLVNLANEIIKEEIRA